MPKCSRCPDRARPGQRLCGRCHAAYMREWRKTHPLTGEALRRARVRAYTKVYVRRGKIPRQPCEVCGEQAEVHHTNYDTPFSIRWLCREHHLELHRQSA